MMTKRIAKKIVGGRAEGRSMATMAEAHRTWWRSVSRSVGIGGTVPRTMSGLAVQGGRFFTVGGRYLYLQDIDTGRWLLPIFKTEAQAKIVIEHSRRLGGPLPDGRRLINDGDAFVRTVEREFRGAPVDLAVNFVSKGLVLSHQTVSHHAALGCLDVSSIARAKEALAQMRAADPFAWS